MSKRAKVNSVRVIAGRWRGRRLPVLSSDGLRPTTDRVRETVFNWLMHDVAGAHCLDLFAGTGALGFESLSRGADHLCFVEVNHRVADQLRQNIALMDATERSEVITQEGISFLRHSSPRPMDIVFLDPPFQLDVMPEVIALLVEREWLAKGALVYVEQPSNIASVEVPADWKLHRSGRAGQSAYCLYAT